MLAGTLIKWNRLVLCRMKNYKKTKYTCYYTYLATASIFALPPLLFVTFREMYDISYTLLGTLVLTNFCTQLSIDLLFTFFSRFFNIRKTLIAMPLLTSVGLGVYALVPTLFPEHAYIGLVLGTIIFSVSAGLCEVLLSPTVAALPSDNPERDMSMLHSLYGYGVVSVVIISTLFLRIFGTENWMWLTLILAAFPIVSCILYATSPIPDMDISHSDGGGFKVGKGMLLCVMCIFLGSAAENTMTNWISGYMENALHITKVAGDILGMALFAALLAFTRTAYAKYGKNIGRVLLISMSCAVACYLVAGLCPFTPVSMAACVLTGICTSMLWPGMLIYMEEKIPGAGVVAYAMMAAGGDFGASVAPQLMGIVTDTVAASNWAARMCETLSMTPDQVGMKAGMVIGAIFPILGVMLLVYMKKYFAKQN